MAIFDLPHCHWLVSKHEGRFVTNVYSGSMGTLPDQGCVNVRTFNYRIYVDISSGDESTFRLIAKSYVSQPWNCGGKKTDFDRAEFENSENDVPDAEERLRRTTTKYGF